LILKVLNNHLIFYNDRRALENNPSTGSGRAPRKSIKKKYKKIGKVDTKIIIHPAAFFQT